MRGADFLSLHVNLSFYVDGVVYREVAFCRYKPSVCLCVGGLVLFRMPVILFIRFGDFMWGALGVYWNFVFEMSVLYIMEKMCWVNFNFVFILFVFGSECVLINWICVVLYISSFSWNYLIWSIYWSMDEKLYFFHLSTQTSYKQFRKIKKTRNNYRICSIWKKIRFYNTKKMKKFKCYIILSPFIVK